MKIYGSHTSPYVRKCRIVAHEKKLDCEFVVTDLAAPDSPVRRLNPLGKIPVLERNGAEALFDSPVIAEYLDSLAAPTLIPPSGEARWETLCWQALADGLMDATVTRLLESRKPATQRDDSVVARQEGKVAQALAYADARVRGDKPLAGGTFGLADIAIGVALEYLDLRYAHDWRGKHPGLAAWLAAMSARASFVATRPPPA